MADSYVIYACECGNYVAAPTVMAAVERDVVKHVRIEGKVMCSSPAHGGQQAGMRKLVLEEPVA